MYATQELTAGIYVKEKTILFTTTNINTIEPLSAGKSTDHKSLIT